MSCLQKGTATLENEAQEPQSSTETGLGFKTSIHHGTPFLETHKDEPVGR